MLAKLTLAAVLVLSVSCSTQPVDADRDGLADELEATLARELFPALHHSQDAETCPQPLSPKPVLFRARRPAVQGVADPEIIAVNFVVLYDRDCGDVAHRGDNEAFVVFARAAGGDRYVFDSMAATAHANTAGEVRTSSRLRDLWIEANKHSNYAPAQGCRDCPKAGPEWEVRLFNVGEPGAPLLSDLGSVNAAYRGIDPWSETDLFFDAGRIGLESLRLTHFDYLTRPPGSRAVRWDD